MKYKIVKHIGVGEMFVVFNTLNCNIEHYIIDEDKGIASLEFSFPFDENEPNSWDNPNAYVEEGYLIIM